MKKYLLVLLCIVAMVAPTAAATVPTYSGNFIGKTSPWFDPRNYGAKCDDTGDDSAAITAMFAAMPANGPATAFFPGICRITSAVLITGKQNVTILGLGGDGANAAAAIGAAGLDCATTTTNCLNVYGDTLRIDGLTIARPNNATAGCSLDVQGSSHSIIEHVVTANAFNAICLGGHTAPYGTQGDINFNEISGVVLAGGKAISFNGNTNGVVLREVHFGGPQDTASAFIWFDPTQTIDTVDLQSGGCFGFGQHLVVAPNVGQGVIDVFITKLLCDGAKGGGAGVVIDGPGQCGVAIDHSFFGAFHEDDNPGALVGGSNACSGSIKDTQISGFGRAGVRFDTIAPGDFVLAGNEIEGNSNTTPDAYPAVEFAADSGHARIYDNYLNGNGSQDYAVKFLGNATLVVISRNELGGDTGQISYGAGTLTNVSIFNNTLYQAPTAYNPYVQATTANTFTQLQTFSGGTVASAGVGVPLFLANGGNFYSAPNFWANGNNNPGIRITDTFGGGGSDWGIAGGQSNSYGTGNLEFFDAVNLVRVMQLQTVGDLVLEKSGGTFRGKFADSTLTASTPTCKDGSKVISDCSAVSPSSFARATTCSSSTGTPCAFTWTCTMSSGACTTTQSVPTGSNCVLEPGVSPDLSATNVVSHWVTLSSTTLTVHVQDLLGTSSAAFSGNGHCL